MRPVKNGIHIKCVIAIREGVDVGGELHNTARRIQELKDAGAFYDYIPGNIGEVLSEDELSFEIRTNVGRYYRYAVRYNWEEIQE